MKQNSNFTNRSEYLPNKNELRLLEILLDPTSRIKTVTDICKDAKISRVTYYAISKRDEFRKLYLHESIALIHMAVMPIVHSLVREAIRGSAPHQKMALEMAGLLKPTVTHEAGRSFEDILREIHGLPPLDRDRPAFCVR